MYSSWIAVRAAAQPCFQCKGKDRNWRDLRLAENVSICRTACQVNIHIGSYIKWTESLPTKYSPEYQNWSSFLKADKFTHHQWTFSVRGLITCGDHVDEEKTPLAPIEQAILLALGEQYKYTTAKDEMQAWQIVAFANAVLSQEKTRYILQLAATLSRWPHSIATIIWLIVLSTMSQVLLGIDIIIIIDIYNLMTKYCVSNRSLPQAARLCVCKRVFMRGRRL